MSLLIILAAFASLLFITLVLRQSLLVSSAIALLISLLLNGLFLDFGWRNLLHTGLHGLLTAAEISLLVFGALLFFNYLKAGDFIAQLEKALTRFSSNKGVIVILLAFFFGAFVEGVSGFGTPAMIVAPLLLGLRFPAALAAALPLLANTVPVVFGAVGTPVKVGFADLPTEHVPVYAAILMTIPALLLPFAFGRYLEAEKTLDASPNQATGISLGAGLCFVLPFVLFSFTGPDFPSICAAVVGLAGWMFFLKRAGQSAANVSRESLLFFVRTFRPYLFVAALLVVGKMALGDSRFIVEWNAVGLVKNIAFFQPGLFFIAALLLLEVFGRNGKSGSLTAIAARTAATLPSTFATIACLTVLAKLLSQNLQVGQWLGTGVPAVALYVLAVATGFTGSFMAGSATVSNLLFGAEWHQIGQQYAVQMPLLLACQLAGSALGNGLSVQNIAMVQAVLNEKGLEGKIIGKLWRPMLLFFAVVSLVAVGLGFLPQ